MPKAARIRIAVSIDKKRYILTRSDIFKKSALAKKMNCSHTWVNRLIEQGRVIEVDISGGSFVFINPDNV
jgi:hypothetical protein